MSDLIKRIKEEIEDRIKDANQYAYLKEPNPTGDTVIAMLNNLPDEFELKSYIDYEKQFSKAFLDPMIGILNVIGWEHERKTNIMSFFT